MVGVTLAAENFWPNPSARPAPSLPACASPGALLRAKTGASLCGCCASAAHPHPPPLPGQRRVAYALLRRCGSSARLRSAAPAPSFFPGFLGLRLPHSCTADHSCWFCLLLVGPAPIRTVCSSFARLCFPIRCVAGKSSRGPMWVLQECCPTHTRRRSRPGPVPPLPRSSAASACGPALLGRALFALWVCCFRIPARCKSTASDSAPVAPDPRGRRASPMLTRYSAKGLARVSGGQPHQVPLTLNQMLQVELLS